MPRVRTRVNPPSVLNNDQQFLSYDAQSPGRVPIISSMLEELLSLTVILESLKIIPDKIRHLQFTINSVEEQYEKALMKLIALDMLVLPISMADHFLVLY